MFSVRIISADHYQSMPTPGLDVTYSQFRGTQVKQVPVIRIFGTTPTGQKTCLHVHGVFPYFYVPYDGSDESARLMYQIAASLDKAINISLGHSNSNTHHVFKIVQVSGKPFYGYHSKEHQFLKIFLYNPLLLKRAVDLLQNGVICNRVFQPHEAHIPFILQFFIDYNLYGMNFINVKSVLRRIDVSSEENMNCDSVILVKESLCELEADAVATDILNRLSVSGELAVNPGLAAIWEDEKQRRGEREISQQESQPRPCRNSTISELLLKEKLKENLRMQGRTSGQRSVLQEIPYPAETQEGSSILNASSLDTHMPSLELPTQIQQEEFVVNEELALSLTSTTDENGFTSQDKSMVYMLMELVEMNADKRANQEVLKAAIDQNVEDDSILGSQMLVENEEDEVLQGTTAGVQEDECQNSSNYVNEELLSEYEERRAEQRSPSSHHSTEENCDNETVKTSESGVHWDDTFWDALTDEDIPQLDGADDILFDEDEDYVAVETKLENIEFSTENSLAEFKITDLEKSSTIPTWNSNLVKDSNWCNEIYDFSIQQIDGMNVEGDDESDLVSAENAGNKLNNILRGDPTFTSSVGSLANELTSAINKSSSDNSIIVPVKELESTCKKNIVSDVCMGRLDSSCDVKQSVWKDASESDIYKPDCKDDSNEYSTHTVPFPNVSISEIEGCENVCDGIVCSEPLCYDNLLEISQFDDNLEPTSFIEYQKVEPMVGFNKSVEATSPYRKIKHTTVVSHRLHKGKLKIKFSFSYTKKLTRKLKKITQKSSKLRLIKCFTDDVTEDMVSTYFTQLEMLKQCNSAKELKTDRELINLSWSKISTVKSQWRKNRPRQNSTLKTSDMNSSLNLDNLNNSSFESDIKELLPCGDLSVSLYNDQASPAKNKYKEISPKRKLQNCDIKDGNNSVSGRNCIVTVQQLTCDNIDSVLKHHQVKSPDLNALQQCMSVDPLTHHELTVSRSRTNYPNKLSPDLNALQQCMSVNPLTHHELTVSRSCTNSPNKSLLTKSSDLCVYQIEQTETNKTESVEQSHAALKVSLHEMLLSGFHSSISSENCLSSKLTQCQNVPEESVEQFKKAVVIVSKLNSDSLVNVYQCQSECVSGVTSSPSKSQPSKSCDVCQVEEYKSHKVMESEEQLKPTPKITLPKLQQSYLESNNFSSTKFMQHDSVPEKKFEQFDIGSAVVNKLNTQSSVSVRQSQSKSVTNGTDGISDCFVKLERIDCCEAKLKGSSGLKSKTHNPGVELQGNRVSQKSCKTRNETGKLTECTQKLKSIEKDNDTPLCSVAVRHERFESSATLVEPNIDKKVTSPRQKKNSKMPVTPIQGNMLSTNCCLSKEVNTLHYKDNKTCQITNICENRRRTLRMSNFHNIQCNINHEKNVWTLELEKENKRLNEKGNQISKMHKRQSKKLKSIISNIVCIDGSYDGSSSDSCDISCSSRQKSNSNLTETPHTPKRRGRVQGDSKHGTPKHRYSPLKIEIKKSPTSNEIKKSPTSKNTSYEHKNSQLEGKLQAECRAVVEKDSKDIRKTNNKRPAGVSELDTSAAEKTKVPKKVKVELKRVHIPVDTDSVTDSRVESVRTRSKKKTDCLPQETSNSSDVTNKNRRGRNDLRMPEPRVCLRRLSFKNGKPVLEENRRLTRTMSRLNNTQRVSGCCIPFVNVATEFSRHIDKGDTAPRNASVQKNKASSDSTSTEIVISDAEEENVNLINSAISSTVTKHVQGSKKMQTTSEFVKGASDKKKFSGARKRLHFPKPDVPTLSSQSTSDSVKSKKHFKQDISVSVLSDSDSSTDSLVMTQKRPQNSKPTISVNDESVLPTSVSNEDSNVVRKDISQSVKSTINNENVGKTKKMYIPDYDAQPSTSHGARNVLDKSMSEPLFASPRSIEKLSQSTNPSITECSDILTLSCTRMSETEFNIDRMHSDSEYEKGIISFYNISNKQNMTAMEQSKNTNCEKLVRLQGIKKPNTTYTLSRKPPNRYEVCQNLLKYGFPEVINKEPFVSNPADTVKSKEVGGKVLKLMSRSVRDLEEFESDFSVLSRWQEKLVADVFGSSCFEKKLFCNSSVLATDRQVVITPLQQAPTVNEAKLWCSMRLATDDAEEETKEIKVSKIVVPASPGHDDEDETTVSLTPSTCSSSATKASGQVELVHSTPQAGDNNYRPCISPVYTPIVLYDKICFKFKSDGQKKQRRRSSIMSHSDQDILPLIIEEEDSKTVIHEDTKIVSEDDSLTVTEDGDSKTVVKVDSKTAVENNSETITENKSTADRDQMVQDENSVEKPSNRDAVKKEQKPTVQPTKKLGKTHLYRRLSDLSRTSASASCRIDTVTPDNSGGYKMALENLQCARSVNQHQYLTVMSMELHVATRGDLRPDPEFDAIRGIFYHVINDAPEHHSLSEVTGVMIVGDSDNQLISSYGDECVLHFADTEQALLHQFIQIVRKWDPDIFIGFEIEMLSWGFLIQRSYVLSINMNAELSRIQPHARRPQKDGEDDVQSSAEKDHEIKLIGRVVLNGWRLFRHEVALQSYTFENLMYHILHRRIPLFSFHTLTLWWNHRSHLYRWMTVEHYVTRVVGTVKLLVQLDFFERTSELSRLFGIQFYEVLSRGSQFRVESMMLRLAKPLNYVSVSPSIKQRAHMRAPGCLPLIMEPESRFYSDPVIVLDFQSLYPSMIIAYNYCFSTCLGRVDHLGQSELFEFGCTQLRVPFGEIVKLEEQLNFSPCGVAFVKPSVRKGILPRMLEEILNTRLMVKKSMKKYKDNKVLQRVLESRQLGLKLIANVTYGYTAANFSGRMPCSEVGDSVVSKGRETLERAISLVKNTPKWGAEVVYGDTDSLFVMVPGKDRKEAFRIGAEIAEAVTNDNPPPVKLKLEKVFQPCILQTKKRYVGYMYENPDEEKPVYNAKGIETVRRDGCPAVAKILEKSLKLLFDTKDVSLVKNYVTRQFSKILLGRLSVQELTFAREYRGASGYKPGACVPALELAKQWLAVDPRSEPRVGERVPYVITAGPPGLPLIRSVRSPHELLADPTLKINTEYYITKVIIPPLDRCFSLIGAQVLSWFSDLPRKQHTYLPSAEPLGVRKGTISQYFATVTCVICQEYTHTGVCSTCQKDPQKVAVYLADKLSAWERKYSQVIKLCQSCCGRSSGIDCTSLDCPVLYIKYQARKDLKQAPYIKQLQQDYLLF